MGELEELVVQLASEVRALRYENMQLKDAKLLKAVKAFRATSDVASREAVIVAWCSS